MRIPLTRAPDKRPTFRKPKSRPSGRLPKPRRRRGARPCVPVETLNPVHRLLMQPLVVAFCDTAERGHCGVGKKICTIEFYPRMHAPVLILIVISVAPQSKRLLNSSVTFIPSVV